MQLHEILDGYREWDLMREMGYTQAEMDATPGDKVRLWMQYMAAERQAKAWAHEDATRRR